MRTGYQKKLAQLLLAIHGLPRAKRPGSRSYSPFCVRDAKMETLLPHFPPFLPLHTNQPEEKEREGGRGKEEHARQILVPSKMEEGGGRGGEFWAVGIELRVEWREGLKRRRRRRRRRESQSVGLFLGKETLPLLSPSLGLSLETPPPPPLRQPFENELEKWASTAIQGHQKKGFRAGEEEGEEEARTDVCGEG